MLSVWLIYNFSVKLCCNRSMKNRVLWTITIKSVFSYVLHWNKILSDHVFCIVLLVSFCCPWVFSVSKLTPILQKMYEVIARAQRKALVSVFPIPFGLLSNRPFWTQISFWKCCTKWLTGPTGSYSVSLHELYG